MHLRCDTVSAFRGKGKIKPLKLLIKSQHYINTFAMTSNDPGISPEQLEILQQFVCDIYGHMGESTNFLRYKIYSSRQGKLEVRAISSCCHLRHHAVILKRFASRISYQTYIRRSYLQGNPNVPSPVGYD